MPSIIGNMSSQNRQIECHFSEAVPSEIIICRGFASMDLLTRLGGQDVPIVRPWQNYCFSFEYELASNHANAMVLLLFMRENYL